jgi:hypothetical protein
MKVGSTRALMRLDVSISQMKLVLTGSPRVVEDDILRLMWYCLRSRGGKWLG